MPRMSIILWLVAGAFVVTVTAIAFSALHLPQSVFDTLLFLAGALALIWQWSRRKRKQVDPRLRAMCAMSHKSHTAPTILPAPRMRIAGMLSSISPRGCDGFARSPPKMLPHNGLSVGRRKPTI
jgi:hypothetical protein